MKYIHFRFAYLNPKDNKTLLPKAKGGVTVAFDRNKDEIRTGVAICGNKDNYNKKIGRSISAGRLDFLFTGTDKLTDREFVNHFRDLLCMDHSMYLCKDLVKEFKKLVKSGELDAFDGW